MTTPLTLNDRLALSIATEALELLKSIGSELGQPIETLDPESIEYWIRLSYPVNDPTDLN